MAQSPSRSVHPGIADPLPGLLLRPSPHFAVADGEWNHGEGFAPNDQPDEDWGAWFSTDDGTGLEISDVNIMLDPSWAPFDWSWPFFNGGAVTTMLRTEGYLRPVGVPLPTLHPLYGDVSAVLPNGYVDQGAFEMFTPVVAPTAGQKILICVLNWQSRSFPKDRDGRRLAWRQTYMGIFSPDGLERREQPGNLRTPQDFANNTDDGTDSETGVFRHSGLQVLASWNPTMSYWPIVAYAVPSVMHRQTTLNEQRNLQLVQAAKLLLQEAGPRNPVYPQAALTPAQVEARCVVCFAGGSNGGMTSQLAPLRYPNLVHGCFAEVINPAYQRLYGEFDMVTAVARMTGEQASAGLSSDDFLHWDQYAWSQGLEMHDLSYLRRFLAGTSHRPAVFGVGDEDITSTGTDWARVLDGSQWADHGCRASR